MTGEKAKFVETYSSFSLEHGNGNPKQPVESTMGAIQSYGKHRASIATLKSTIVVLVVVGVSYISTLISRTEEVNSFAPEVERLKSYNAKTLEMNKINSDFALKKRIDGTITISSNLLKNYDATTINNPSVYRAFIREARSLGRIARQDVVNQLGVEMTSALKASAMQDEMRKEAIRIMQKKGVSPSVINKALGTQKSVNIL